MNYNEIFNQAINRLNENQKKAVDTLEGPVMVIAGPGTGKTQVIAARIGNILKKTDAQPQNILCLTYTEAGTIAMRDRLIQFIGPTAYNINIYTFHAFCNDVIQDNLRYFGGIRELQVVNELEEVEIYENLIDDLPNDHILKRLTGDTYFERGRLKSLFELMKKENWTPEYLIKRANQYLEELKFDDRFRYKNTSEKLGYKKGDLKEKDYNKEVEKIEKFKAAALLFHDYNNRLKEMKRYDFHDMILWVLEAFKSHPDLLLDYQEKFQYFLVDEYQDTNGAQNDLLYTLCDYWEAPNVFVVGDDDQSIFRFQGANMENIMAFKERYDQHLTEVVLTDNYRSTQAILDASRQLILHGEERLEAQFPHLTKTLQSQSYSHHGSHPKVRAFYNTEHEKAFIIQQIVEAQEAGRDLSEMAVIYRNHKDVENIIKALEQKGIPLNLKRKFNVLEVPWIDQILDICQYISDESLTPYKAEHLLPKIMHFKYFDIHPHDIARLATYCSYDRSHGQRLKWREVLNDDGELEKIGFADLNSIKRFRDNVNRWIKDSFNETVQVILEKILNYGGILGHLLQSRDKAWKMQLLSTLFDFVKEESRRMPFMRLSDLMDTVSKMKKYNISLPIHRVLYNARGVHFVTAHSSKGLEFKRVYIINAISKKWEGKTRRNSTYTIPPTVYSKSEENTLEDERRLFYVAMTRAEEELNISYSLQTPEEKALQKSRFITEMQEAEVIDYDPENIQNLSDDQMLEYSLAQLLNKTESEFSFIDHDEVDKVLEKFKLSVTALNKYLQCPVSFYFENILRVPSARTVHTGFGNVVHSTLELFHNQAKRNNGQFGSAEDLLDIFDSQMSIYHSHFTQKEYEDRQAFGHQFLPEYYREYIERWKATDDFIMEYNISQAVCEDVPIKGRLDKLEIKKDHVHVIDFKTGKYSNATRKMKSPDDKEPNGGDYWRQIVYYRILLESDPKNNWIFDKGTFDFVQPDDRSGKFQFRTIPIDQEDVDMVRDQIVNSYAAIQKHRFEKGCNEEDCAWCNFVKYNELDMAGTRSDEAEYDPGDITYESPGTLFDQD